MLSFRDGWKFSTRGLAAICKEGPDAILSALRELENNGYLIRQQSRGERGRMSSMIYEIYEKPYSVKPGTETPCAENPVAVKSATDNPAGISTDQEITKQNNNNENKDQSINLDRMDGMDLRKQYGEIVIENIDLHMLGNRFDSERVHELLEIIIDTICSSQNTVRINGSDIPHEVVKSRFLKLTHNHIEYVLQAMDDCPSEIRNIRAYLLTTLYNASLTIDSYYSARVNHDLNGSKTSHGYDTDFRNEQRFYL